jgi:cobalt/nickel transport system permease protein
MTVGPRSRRVRRSRSFVERSLGELLGALERSATAVESAERGGLLQTLDPRVKLVGLFALVLAASFASDLRAIVFVFAVALALALLSHVGVHTLAKRGWLPALIFTVPVALPAIVTTPGEVLILLPVEGLAVSVQGVRSLAILVSRVLAATTMTLLLVLTTPWPHVLKALHSVGVPAVLVAILGMTHRYLHTLLQSSVDMFEARRSRTVGVLAPGERRRVAASAVGALIGKSSRMSDEIYLSMRSRGFRGEIRILDDFRARPRDWLALAAFLAVAVTVAVLGSPP